jgi:hypothetical protein
VHLAPRKTIEGILAMPHATVISYLPRQRPADHALHVMARAHASAHEDFIASEGNDNLAAQDAAALVSCLALVPARTREGLADKARVLRDVMSSYGSTQVMLDEGNEADLSLLLSFAQDAAALALL